MSAAVDSSDAGELRRRKPETHDDSESDEGINDVVSSPKTRKTYGRTPDGTSK